MLSDHCVPRVIPVGSTECPGFVKEQLKKELWAEGIATNTTKGFHGVPNNSENRRLMPPTLTRSQRRELEDGYRRRENKGVFRETVFLGKERQFNRRFLQMCSHYLVEPVACTPASGWEKGQVENQVGLIRERFFTPRVRVKSFDELNAWLLDRCVAYAKAHKHPEFKDQTIWQVFEAERASLIAVPGRFDGFHAVMASVSKTCLVSFDRNKYSVSSQAVGRRVEVQAYADRIVIRQDGAIVGEHARSFGRGQTLDDPWHDVPVLTRKPGALRNGAPFKNWVLPSSLERVRQKLRGSDDGDRQMVAILAAALIDGLAAVEAACAEALSQGVHSSGVILNILARKKDPGPALTIATPEALHLKCAPAADCARYDSLRRISPWNGLGSLLRAD